MIVLGIASVVLAAQATAIGLGPATLSSGLGEPLRLSIPVTLQPDDDVGCVQVRSHGDDLPTVYNTRAQVLRSATRTRIEIQSAQAVDEPAIGLVVSVGCASPVARDYVLFLDPPVVGTTPAESDATPVPLVATPRPRTPRARAPAADTSTASVADRPARPRPARRRVPPPATAGPRADGPAASAPTGPAAKAPTPRPTPARAAPGGDRLSVVPTEPPVIARTSPSPQPGAFPPAVQGGPSSPSGAAGAAGAAGAGTAPAAPASTVQALATTVTPGAALPATATAPATDADAQAREEALRQQQALLQSQIKSLGDQIALLRVQTASLAVRNQSLEASAFSPTLVWLLIALTVIAIVVAGWMAWRYTQLRRSLEGSAWWTGQTGHEGVAAGDGTPAAASGTAMPVGATRSMPRAAATGAAIGTAIGTAIGSEARPKAMPAQAPQSPPPALVSNIDRVKPAVRAPGSSYPAAMDTDFTVSDIEAAMATVRTVSPSRSGKAADPLEDSDFAGLGGPTITSPFSDEQPEAQSPSVADDDMAHFVDLEIPAAHARSAAERTATPSGTAAPFVPSMPIATLDFPMRGQTVDERTRPGGAATDASPPAVAGTSPDLDFRFDVPEDFDPLASDSLKTTLIDRLEPVASDHEAASGPTELDFELPSQTQILSMTVLDRGAGGGPRQGSSALDDLFAPNPGDLHDTVFELDDRDGAPLSKTEVDRLTAPAIDPTVGVPGVSGRSRLVRVADLMTHIDEVAITDPLSAIASLRQYVLRDEHIPTLMWLRLFELYKIVDKRQVHDALAEHFARRYHRPMVGWTETLADRTPQRPLSALTRLDQEIESEWGSEAGLLHLERLLCDRAEEDAIVFNAILQRDLLDAVKIYPDPADFGRSGSLPAAAP